MASTPYVPDDIPTFDWPDWLVFSSVLAISVGIGIFFGCFGKKNQTNEEYLLGGRSMNPVPVALSLLCSYVSSITLLGTPVEIYFYGMQLSMVLIAYIPLTLSLAFVYVPIYFQLQYVSIYEYLEVRFSRLLRILCSVINIIYGIFFMSLVVYAPALALKLIVGIDHRILVAIIFLVCIFYSSIGGFKAVLWTDSLQAVIMVVSMAVVAALGTSNLGGVSEVWKIADSTDRLNFFNWDADPRTRHTIWTAVIGGYFQWLPMYANQAQIQRYISLPNYNAVYQALGINLLGLFFLMGLTYYTGMVVYGTYLHCDPVFTNPKVTAADQLLPIFVVETLQDYPGLAGLFVAGITCAGLSTVSSGVNALSASIVEDYIKKWFPMWNETKLAIVSKAIAAIVGLLAFGFVFIAELMGNIFTAATSLFGIFGGPTFGVFVCGMFFPWTNNIGVTSSLIISVAIMSVIGVGQTVYTNKNLLPIQWKELDLTCPARYEDGVSYNSTIIPETDWKTVRDDDFWTQMFSISPLWYPAYGILLSTILGLILSFLATLVYKKNLNPPLQSKLFIPVMLTLYKKICPNELSRMLIFTEEELLKNPELKSSSSTVSSYTPRKASEFNAKPSAPPNEKC